MAGDSPVPQRPQPGDLAVGPLIIPGGQRLATADPAGYGDHGSYKIPFIVTAGATVTVTIAGAARGHVVISNPYAPAGVTAATYRSCPRPAGFFAQGFAFTGGQTRGLRAARRESRRSATGTARHALAVRRLLPGLVRGR